MYTITQDKCSSYGVVKLIVDLESEVSSLPTHFTPGSKAIILENSKVFMLTNKKTWIEIKISTSGGGGGGDTPTPDEEIVYDGGSF